MKLSPEEVDARMQRRGEVIDLADHSCQFNWCTGTIWPTSHWNSLSVPVTGREHDVTDALAVGVILDFDETQHTAQRILLHFASDITGVDVDVSTTASQAPQIAIAMLMAADAIEVNRLT